MTPSFRSFAGARSGSAAVEFALLGSIFFVLLFGHIEIGYLMFLQHRLDDATVSAARAIQLGSAQRRDVKTAAEFSSAFLCPALGKFFDCSRTVVDSGVLSAGSTRFDGSIWARTPVGSRATNSYCLGSAGEYMFLRVSYPQRPIIGALLPRSMFVTYQGEAVTMLQSFAALRIEPTDARRTGKCGA